MDHELIVVDARITQANKAKGGWSNSPMELHEMRPLVNLFSLTNGRICRPCVN